jgi:hypothetical protein
MENKKPDWHLKIDDYILGKLSETENEAFEKYCFGHPEFLQEVRIRELMLKLIKKEPGLLGADIETEISVQKQHRKISIGGLLRERKGVWIYAAAAVLVMIILFVVPRLLREEENNRYAENFIESPHLETLVGETFRSGAISISFLSPEKGENFNNSVLFKWEITPEGEALAEPLELLIMTNKEKESFRGKVREKEFVLQKKLQPGLYYWAMEYQGETLYLGKFFVHKPEEKEQQ